MMLNVVVVLNLFFILTSQHGEESSEITELDTSTINKMVAQSKTTAVLFFAPWCGHCKNLMPKYETTCQELKQKYPSTDILCARVDCTKSEAVCTEHQIQEYPTLKILRDSYECKYSGPRTKAAIYQSIVSSHNAVNELNDLKQVQELVDSANESLVGFFTDSENPSRKLSQELACEMPSINFVITSSPEVAKHYSFEQPNSHYLLKTGKVVHKIENAANVSDIVRIIFFHLNPLVPEYSYERSSTVFSQVVTKYLALVYNSSDQDGKVYKDELEAYAKIMFGQVRVFTVDGSDRNNKNIVDYFRLKTFPSIVFYDDTEKRFFYYNQEVVDPTNLVTFVSGCLDGSIRHYVRKQPIPDDWDKLSVKQLVVDNFDEVFKLGSKGAILFYASWCSHCEALMPTWYKIGDDLKETHPEVFIARVDHVENEITGVKIEGYPTIYVYKSPTEKILYEGAGNYDQIMEFLNKHLELAQPASGTADSHQEL